jgi:molybdopterin converting factor small subunit
VKIHFKLFGGFRDLVDRDGVVVDVPLGVGLHEGLEILIRSHPELEGRILDEAKSLQSCALAFLNGRNIRTLEESNPRLNDGDTVVLTPLLGGG